MYNRAKEISMKLLRLDASIGFFENLNTPRMPTNSLRSNPHFTQFWLEIAGHTKFT
jgi:hypothetical protein